MPIGCTASVGTWGKVILICNAEGLNWVQAKQRSSQ